MHRFHFFLLLLHVFTWIFAITFAPWTKQIYFKSQKCSETTKDFFLYSDWSKSSEMIKTESILVPEFKRLKNWKSGKCCPENYRMASKPINKANPSMLLCLIFMLFWLYSPLNIFFLRNFMLFLTIPEQTNVAHRTAFFSNIAKSSWVLSMDSFCATTAHKVNIKGWIMILEAQPKGQTWIYETFGYFQMFTRYLILGKVLSAKTSFGVFVRKSTGKTMIVCPNACCPLNEIRNTSGDQNMKLHGIQWFFTFLLSFGGFNPCLFDLYLR